MDMQEPPAIVEPWLGSGSTGLIFELPQPRYLTIAGQVQINLQDGSIKFEPGYSPDAAARIFWEAMSEDYRKMLKWKSEHGSQSR